MFIILLFTLLPQQVDNWEGLSVKSQILTEWKTLEVEEGEEHEEGMEEEEEEGKDRTEEEEGAGMMADKTQEQLPLPVIVLQSTPQQLPTQKARPSTLTLTATWNTYWKKWE